MIRERFVELWTRHRRGEGAGEPQALFGELVDRYGEGHRCYHTALHIEHCLTELDRVRSAVPNDDAAEMALWYHDAVYDPKASDNEYRSAELFSDRAGDDLEPQFVADVRRLIMITEHGNRRPRREDERYVADVDLSSFGFAWPDFQRDSEKVRAEYPHLSNGEFASNHRRFLQSLLERSRIYATEVFYRRYETRARENISRLLATLGGLQDDV